MDVQDKNVTLSPTDQPEQPPMPGAPKTLTRAEYLADSNFLTIDGRLRSDNSLNGYDVI